MQPCKVLLPMLVILPFWLIDECPAISLINHQSLCHLGQNFFYECGAALIIGLLDRCARATHCNLKTEALAWQTLLLVETTFPLSPRSEKIFPMVQKRRNSIEEGERRDMLASIRKNPDKTQEELAVILEVSQSTVSRTLSSATRYVRKRRWTITPISSWPSRGGSKFVAK